MGTVSGAKFSMYKEKILSLPLRFTDEDILNEKFLLEKDASKKLTVYYTPFDYINENARIVIAGITPGLHQMKKAYTTVLENKESGLTDEEILHQVKMKASFEGSMRKNLVAMLDELGLQNHLGIVSASELFSSASHLVYNTSILPHAVFFDGKNFNGSRPNIIKTDMLLKYVKNDFAININRLDKPLIIPLGDNVEKVLKVMIKNEWVEGLNMVTGFPHPSGGNGHRHRQFRENKEEMIKQLDDFFTY